MSPSRRRFQLLIATCLAMLGSVVSPAGSVLATSIPYGTVEVFGANWAGQYASWGDLNVYSNGDGTHDRLSTYGQQYECVEFVQRWAAIRFGEQPTWGGNAWQLWAVGPNLRVALTQHPNGSDAPAFGDIMVFDRSPTSVFGHVAVVAGVGPGHVDLVEQNWGSSGFNRIPMDSATHVPDRAGLPVVGWLRGPAVSTPPPPPVTLTGNTVPPPRRVAVVATDGRMWASTGSSGALVQFGNDVDGTPALIAEPPMASTSRGVVDYLATNADSHQLYVRGDSGLWTLASVGARCLGGPAAVLTASGGTLFVTVACTGTDHGIWLTTSAFTPGVPLSLDGSWIRYGGVTSSGPAIGLLGGRPTVLVTGTDHHLWQRSSSTPWTPIVPTLSCTGHPALAASGRLAWLACHGGDDALWYTSGVDGAWAPPRSAGGVVVDGPGLSADAGGATVDVEGSDRTVWEATLSTTAGPSVWAGEGWSVRAGPGAVARPILPTAFAATASDGSLQIERAGASPANLGGTLAAAPAVVPVASADPGSQSSPLVVAIFGDRSLQVRSDTAGWQPLTSSGASCVSSPGALMTGAPGSQTLTVACEGLDHALWYASGPIPAQGLPTLTGWRSLGGSLTSGPALAELDGTITFAAVGGGNQLYWASATMGWGALPGWLCSGRPALAGTATVTYLACQGMDQALWWSTGTGRAFTSARSAGGVLIDGPGIAAFDEAGIVVVEGSDTSLWETRIAPGQSARAWRQLPGTSAVGGVSAAAL